MCVLLPPHSKFHLNETTCSWVIAKKWFSIRRPSAMLNLRISDFFLVSVVCGKICDCILNFVQFGRFAAEIWRYSLMIFKMAAVHHVGLGFSKFDIFIIHVRAMPPNSKFRLNRTIWSRVIAKKNIFNMASVGHLEFGNFWIFVTFPSPCSISTSAYQVSSNSDDSRLRYGSNDFQNGGRPPFWIYCDVIILYSNTEFNALTLC